jgi:hypothetical protein
MINEDLRQQGLDVLLPLLEKLLDQLPQYGEISLRAKICDYKIGTTSVGIECSQKTPKPVKKRTPNYLRPHTDVFK